MNNPPGPRCPFIRAAGGGITTSGVVSFGVRTGAGFSFMPDAATAFAAAAGMEASSAGLEAGLRESEAWARAEGGAVCIAGSLFLAGEVLEARGIAV